MKIAAVSVASLALAGCASITSPYPPALNLPTRVTDLSAVQRGAQIHIQFTISQLSTEAMPIKGGVEADIWIGPSAPKFVMHDWLDTAKELPPQNGTAYVTPAGPYVGKDVVIALRLKNEHGRDAGWSNFVALPIATPVDRPESVKAEATAQGVEVSWTGSAPQFRIYRKTDSGEFSPLGDAKKSPYLDTTAEYGKHYTYVVMGFQTSTGAALTPATKTEPVTVTTTESELSEGKTVTPIDIFPPTVPAGLTAILGTRSIELNWTRDTEPDLAGYRVYRAEGGGPFGLIAGAVLSSSYSDRTASPNVRYRYTVSAYDQIGNESARSAPIEAALP